MDEKSMMMLMDYKHIYQNKDYETKYWTRKFRIRQIEVRETLLRAEAMMQELKKALAES